MVPVTTNQQLNLSESTKSLDQFLRPFCIFLPRKHESIIHSPYISIHILHGLTPCIKWRFTTIRISSAPATSSFGCLSNVANLVPSFSACSWVRLEVGTSEICHEPLRNTPMAHGPKWSLWNVENPYFLPWFLRKCLTLGGRDYIVILTMMPLRYEPRASHLSFIQLEVTRTMVEVSAGAFFRVSGSHCITMTDALSLVLEIRIAQSEPEPLWNMWWVFSFVWPSGNLT